MILHDLKRKITIALVLGFLIFALLIFLSDVREVGKVLQEFNLMYFPLIFLMAPLNYCFRFIKWEYFRKRLHIDCERNESAMIFLAGLSMTVTPAKVGELLKAYLLKERCQVETGKAVSMIMAERFTDGISMLLLAAVGAVVLGYGMGILIFTAIFLLFLGFFLKNSYLAEKVPSVMTKLPLLRNYTDAVRGFHASMQRLLDTQSIIYAVSIGIVSWSFEGVIVYLSLQAMGLEFPLLSSIMVVSFSALVGAISMLPGGLGAVEGSIFAMLLLLGVPSSYAGPVTLITRFSTLWLGVSVGSIGLIYYYKKC